MSRIDQDVSVKLIGAQSLNGVIGRDGRIPWKLPTDMAFFKRTTEGHIVVMGRETFASLPKPLVNRRNVVLSRDPQFQAPGAEVFSGISAAIQALAASRQPQQEIFVIGGETVYAEFLPYASTVYLTIVDAVVDGDAFFPRIEGDWRVQLLESHAAPPEGAGTQPPQGWHPHRIYEVSRHNMSSKLQ